MSASTFFKRKAASTRLKQAPRPNSVNRFLQCFEQYACSVKTVAVRCNGAHCHAEAMTLACNSFITNFVRIKMCPKLSHVNLCGQENFNSKIFYLVLVNRVMHRTNIQQIHYVLYIWRISDSTKLNFREISN